MPRLTGDPTPFEEKEKDGLQFMPTQTWIDDNIRLLHERYNDLNADIYNLEWMINAFDIGMAVNYLIMHIVIHRAVDPVTKVETEIRINPRDLFVDFNEEERNFIYTRLNI